MEIEYMNQRVRPNIEGFVIGDAIQLLCGGLIPYEHGKSNAHSLTPIMI